MRVLLVITGLSTGGAERVATDLADALAASGCEVMLVYLTGPLEFQPRRPEVAVLGLGMDSAGASFSAYLRLRRVLREFRPDIVHAHMFHAIMLTRLLRLSMTVPRIISTTHSREPGKRRLRAMAYRVTDALTDISTNVSRDAVDSFVATRAVPEGRMVAVHNGIAVNEFRSSPAKRLVVRASFAVSDDCKLLLAVGRLIGAKDYPNLFDALAQLRNTLPFKLLIAGDGSLRPQLENRVVDLGLSEYVQFLGVRHDIADLMCAADVFVLSSVWESFGMVVAEAMASECVVVATDSGGVREVLGDAGFLVPPRDSVALAASLLAAASLPERNAAELGRAARRRIVETYSLDRSLDKWRELYGS